MADTTPPFVSREWREIHDKAIRTAAIESLLDPATFVKIRMGWPSIRPGLSLAAAKWRSEAPTEAELANTSLQRTLYEQACARRSVTPARRS